MTRPIISGDQRDSLKTDDSGKKEAKRLSRFFSSSSLSSGADTATMPPKDENKKPFLRMGTKFQQLVSKQTKK